jgi:hypothetical protein
MKRFTRSFAPTVLAVTSLGVAAAFGTGIANADAVDDTFVATLAEAGIPRISPDAEISAGHAVCQNLSEGATPDRLVGSFNAKQVFGTSQQNVAMIRASITAYCPQYLPQLHAEGI